MNSCEGISLLFIILLLKINIYFSKLYILQNDIFLHEIQVQVTSILKYDTVTCN